MRKLIWIGLSAFVLHCLSGCLASSTSPIGVNCNYGEGKPEWELPLACQGR